MASDTVFIEAHLPQRQRVTFERPCPAEVPVWGSIIDGLWAIEQPEGPTAGSSAHHWMTRAERQWGRFNVPLHHGKSVNGTIGGEVQGACIDGREHWPGTSRPRRLLPSRRQPVTLSSAAWYELLVAALGLPLAQHDLAAEWSCRVEACDASPGGHGRAWATFPLAVVREMAR